MKRSRKEIQKNNIAARESKRSPTVQTVDVVYKCGHEGQSREIVYEHIGVEQQLQWIKRNVKCKTCYKKG
ncbi:hypothetical protein [Paenibacillus sp. L3-i20]|uniref:hypothetical protein n=1 Tax=Paenibacillus sp. L3-i20 TaxID=2905833 RepID=UPI001EDE43CD|nr:hypothetical protein [Paenibacillus sp. L3-i20]GKU80173.1 hypothetical protein L3i20_v245700 [Paenibacillus sp. L3-i20]